MSGCPIRTGVSACYPSAVAMVENSAERTINHHRTRQVADDTGFVWHSYSRTFAFTFKRVARVDNAEYCDEEGDGGAYLAGDRDGIISGFTYIGTIQGEVSDVCDVTTRTVLFMDIRSNIVVYDELQEHLSFDSGPTTDAVCGETADSRRCYADFRLSVTHTRQRRRVLRIGETEHVLSLQEYDLPFSLNLAIGEMEFFGWRPYDEDIWYMTEWQKDGYDYFWPDWIQYLGFHDREEADKDQFNELYGTDASTSTAYDEVPHLEDPFPQGSCAVDAAGNKLVSFMDGAGSVYNRLFDEEGGGQDPVPLLTLPVEVGTDPVALYPVGLK